MLECVVNVSEGRDPAAIEAIVDSAGPDLLDLHTDPHHHRAVLTLVGQGAARAVATTAIERLDLRTHAGVHPRLGVVDVVPFVPLDGSTMADAISARDEFAGWLAGTHRVPCFLYGPERSLPEVRRGALRDLAPDRGPERPHPSAGVTCVGARPALIAYNVWIQGLELTGARAIATAVRRPGLRALGIQVGDRVQVSMNLVEPNAIGPDVAYDLVAAEVTASAEIERAELVGLLPLAVLEEIAPHRWAELDLSPDRTIEARLAARRVI